MLDISDCIEGSPPVFVSYPHFTEGDAKLLDKLEGLYPNRSNHAAYAYLHPRLGFPLFGISRMQINLKVSSFGRDYEKFNGLILPLAWIETSIEEVPVKFKILFYMSTYVVDVVEVILKYGSIIALIYTLSCLIINLEHYFTM